MPSGLTWRDVIEEWCETTRGIAPAGWPEPLRAFWAAGAAAALSRQNRFRVPQDEDGYSVFYVENQHVCEWAYRTDDAAADPEVWVRDHQGGGWTSIGRRLDAFLSAAAVTEIVLGGAIGRAAEGPTRSVPEVIGLEPIGLPGLGWPAQVTTSYYRGPGVLALAHDDYGYSFVFIGARTPDALGEIDRRIRASPGWQFS